MNRSCPLAAIALFAGLAGAQSLPIAPQAPGPAQFPAGQPAAEAPLLSPQQVDNLVAPIALYPDELLSQILAASTYPLEIVDAEQWMQQNKNLPPEQLVNAAKQQNWDPSVQALVAFPDVLDILGRDIHWTSDLGNAFLAQQADVMAAIQQMRTKAQQAGQLRSGPQQTVTNQYQDGQSAIQIAPTDPQTVYVPEYQPSAVWGPPAYGAYPSLSYPPAWGAYGGNGSPAYPAYGAYGGYGGYGGSGYGGAGIGFSPGVFLGNLFSGLLSFGPWGWGVNWFAHALFLVPQFFAHFFTGWGHGYGGGYYGGALVAGHPLWIHDPVHRLGVPYGNRAVAARFGGSFGGRVGGSAVVASRGLEASRGLAASRGFEASRGYGAGGGAWHGVSGEPGRSEPGRSGFSGETRGSAARQFAARTAPQAAGRGYAGQSYGGQSFAGRGAQAARPEASRQPQMMARNFSAQRGEGSQHFSAPKAPSSHGSASHPSSSHASHGGGGGHSSGKGGHKH